VLSDLLAGYLLAQLENFNNIQEKRLAIWNTYNENLKSWATRNNIRTPFVPTDSEHTGHMYFLRLPNPESRTRLIAHLREKGVMAVFHYQALNESSVGRNLGSKVDDCPVAVEAAETLVRLPLFTNMTTDQLEKVIQAISEFEVV
jgi:dTDP-4-amino-4,6-dideoxygalactose transaminase